MEKYINEKNIVKNEVYELFKDSIICPVCQCLMIEPLICLTCQTKFCKNCQKNLKKLGRKCPNRCNKTSISKVNEKNNFISKFKFKCIKGCGEEIPYNEIKNHYKSKCLSKKNKIKSPLKIKIIDKTKVPDLVKKSGKEVAHLTSKYKYY